MELYYRDYDERHRRDDDYDGDDDDVSSRRHPRGK